MRFEVAPGEIVEFIGPNGSGKTGLAEIVRALAARNANPLGLSIGDARKTYLHKGDEDGYGRLMFNDLDSVEWIPRNATMSGPTTGEFAGPLSRPEAVGLVDFVGRQSDKARASMLQPVLAASARRCSGRAQGSAKGHIAGTGPAGGSEVRTGSRLG